MQTRVTARMVAAVFAALALMSVAWGNAQAGVFRVTNNSQQGYSIAVRYQVSHSETETTFGSTNTTTTTITRGWFTVAPGASLVVFNGEADYDTIAVLMEAQDGSWVVPTSSKGGPFWNYVTKGRFNLVNQDGNWDKGSAQMIQNGTAFKQDGFYTYSTGMNFTIN